ncbi:MAG: sialate O-acetylesterase [bacterium]
MNFKSTIKILFAITFCINLFFTQTISGDVRLPKLISDGMVLQRNAGVTIWGWADEGEKIAVDFKEKFYFTDAGTDGRWSVTLDKSVAGGPYTMTITGNNKIVIHNIFYGEVWVCSGQSNMETPMSRLADKYPEEFENVNNPLIRHFVVPTNYNYKSPQEDVAGGKWEGLDSETIMKFSGVPYFFAKYLFEKCGVPIGIIRVAVGGSPIEAWLSEDVLKNFPRYVEDIAKYRDDAFMMQLMTEGKKRNDEWTLKLWTNDKGTHEEIPWYAENYDASNWLKIQMPAYWADEGAGMVNGVVWLRKEFEVPETFVGKPAKLWLGRIVDADSVYINGKFVGTTGYQYPPRKYQIPADLLKEGKNVVVVKVISNGGKGGFVKDKPYLVKVGNEEIDLKGEWQYRIGAALEPALGPAPLVSSQPLCFYNGMLAPVKKYSIKGVVWYQGESNTYMAKEYQKLLPQLIYSWRHDWNRDDLPFLIIQLHNYMETKEQPSESGWAELREAQLKALSVPNTALVVTIDLGEWNDIHPMNKKDVGYRLSLAARKLAYREDDLVSSGPLYQSAKIGGGKISISFSNIGSGLIAKGGGDLKYFAIAGADKHFVWANAKIENDKVVVWNENVKEPMYVRYAWADNPDGANLYNVEGLPASPFRTDE